MVSVPFEFECRVCHERHRDLPAFAFDAPAQIRVVPPEEEADRVHLTSDTCEIDLDGHHRFVRAQLEIPIRQTNDCFSWGVWVSLSEASFARFLELFHDTRRLAGESFFGWFSSALPEYPDTMYLKSRILTREHPLRPLVELEATEHPLSVDQRDGIAVSRAIELAQRLLHH
jgi:hypothetical protein